MTDAAAPTARHMVRSALKGTLATLDAETGAPYASMIVLATSPDGAPITLLSTLARHTQNLHKSPAASILIDTSNARGDATTGGRITLMGTLIPEHSRSARGRFLARHPAAAQYVDFADFAFFRLDIVSAHLIEGFGRIVPLAGSALRVGGCDFDAFARAEHALLDALKSTWPSVTGFDCEGVDYAEGDHAGRLRFARPALSAEAAHAAAAICLAG
jgi:heme iron utilization protein